MAGLLEINHSAIMKHYWLNDFFYSDPPPPVDAHVPCVLSVDSNQFYYPPPLLTHSTVKAFKNILPI